MELEIYSAFRSAGVPHEGAARIAEMARQYVDWACDRAALQEAPSLAVAEPPLARTVVTAAKESGIAPACAIHLGDTMERFIRVNAALKAPRG